MTMTRYSLEDVGGALSWDALYDFVRNVPASSALFRALHPDEAAWLDGSRVSSLVADVYDLLSCLRTEWLSAHGVNNVKHEPHVRPGDAEREARRIEAARQRLEELDELIGGR